MWRTLQCRPDKAAISGRTATHNGPSTDGGRLHCLPHRHREPEKPTCDLEAPIVNRLHSFTHIHGAHAPVEEPSTASQADTSLTSAIQSNRWNAILPRPRWSERKTHCHIWQASLQRFQISNEVGAIASIWHARKWHGSARHQHLRRGDVRIEGFFVPCYVGILHRSTVTEA
jgi:hypothetical protein